MSRDCILSHSLYGSVSIFANLDLGLLCLQHVYPHMQVLRTQRHAKQYKRGLTPLRWSCSAHESDVCLIDAVVFLCTEAEWSFEVCRLCQLFHAASLEHPHKS